MLHDAGYAGVKLLDVGLRAGVFGFNVGADGQVVTVFGYCGVIDERGEVFDFLAVGILINDSFNIFGRELILVPLMHKKL